jgi:uncharacterized membrane protein
MYNPENVIKVTKGPATAVYALYALSFVFGLTAIIGVIIAHIKKNDAKGSWLQSHYIWQIRSFWWGFFWIVVGVVSSFIFIGYAVLLATSIWFIYRIVKGWLRLSEDRPVE